MEDDPSVRGLLETVLSAEGYAVTTASDGLAGLVSASARRPAVVLLDLVMPDLGGVRVLQELRADPQLREVPVIVVTGQVEAVTGLRTVLGSESVFVKPFGVTELLARVAHLTGRTP
jgi:DNA-binding response OmpR family regulator